MVEAQLPNAGSPASGSGATGEYEKSGRASSRKENAGTADESTPPGTVGIAGVGTAGACSALAPGTAGTGSPGDSRESSQSRGGLLRFRVTRPNLLQEGEFGYSGGIDRARTSLYAGRGRLAATGTAGGATPAGGTETGLIGNCRNHSPSRGRLRAGHGGEELVCHPHQHRRIRQARRHLLRPADQRCPLVGCRNRGADPTHLEGWYSW